MHFHHSLNALLSRTQAVYPNDRGYHNKRTAHILNVYFAIFHTSRALKVTQHARPHYYKAFHTTQYGLSRIHFRCISLTSQNVSTKDEYRSKIYTVLCVHVLWMSRFLEYIRISAGKAEENYEKCVPIELREGGKSTQLVPLLPKRNIIHFTRTADFVHKKCDRNQIVQTYSCASLCLFPKYNPSCKLTGVIHVTCKKSKLSANNEVSNA